MHIVIEPSILSCFAGPASIVPVLGYIDPATGGMLFQILAAVFALFSGFALVFSRQIRMAFARVLRRLRRSHADDEGTTDGQQH